jgi:hypothetical protein
MKIQEIFSGLGFGLDHGIMEEWVFKGYCPFYIFLFRLRRTIYPILQYPLQAVGSTSRRPRLIFPIFQYSTIPRGEMPLTCESNYLEYSNNFG